ncbi:MAG TPA: type II toxin-antitoxin system prevent-host-death family antitoxin [Terriglobia bacterium]|nr:type II toxin-antitoxin system prevent-host-death family antitoxin [Terriglobia bacterium]
MHTVGVAEAKARLSGILTKVEQGREIIITRRGRAVARLSAIEQPKQAIDFAVLDTLRARQPLSRFSSAQMIRKMRDAKY